MTWPVDPLPPQTRANSTKMLNIHPIDHAALDQTSRVIARDFAVWDASDVFTPCGNAGVLTRTVAM